MLLPLRQIFLLIFKVLNPLSMPTRKITCPKTTNTHEIKKLTIAPVPRVAFPVHIKINCNNPTIKTSGIIAMKVLLNFFKKVTIVFYTIGDYMTTK